jgi:O-acetyl-ADP-ribose deacetylase (regulator of RNase III)
VWQGGQRGEAETLASCYRRCLALAVAHEFKSIAFPAISCGAYGYPVDDAAFIALYEVTRFLEQDHRLEKVHLVCYSDDVFDAYRRALDRLGEGGPRDQD